MLGWYVRISKSKRINYMTLIYFKRFWFVHILFITVIKFNYYYSTALRVFSHQRWLMVFHRRLSDSKSPQVSRTLLNIRADLNADVRMISTRPFISKSSSSFTNSLVTVSNAPITIDITVTLMLHCLFVFFGFLARSRYLPLFSILLCGLPRWQSPQFGRFSWLLLLFTPLKFFPSVLADGFSLDFEWQQVSSSLQDPSQDSGHS